MEDRVYWLDGFNGEARAGAYYRSKTAIDIADFEDKFGKKVVAIGIEKDYETGKPSWNLHMITEHKPEGETTYE